MEGSEGRLDFLDCVTRKGRMKLGTARSRDSKPWAGSHGLMLSVLA